ncbi:MAG: AraC family transcriptional regulator [Prosthecobacter sp.]|jgi:PAS domain S-box-containing protein|uniref:AraC family transcriptional regulator n=1 Tax=Prosthecobacter sp. TaxID=1965333 RepID=UPI0019FDA025|nr:AraC family transcriptional regulator [Prosthecobacter sp.]MBE2283790.1 AraC family transcriptional regulator [Prosthecobacter sp.]
MAAISPQAFLRQLRGSELVRLFDLLPDMSFFIKDRQGRFMALNHRGCEYCGVKREKDAIGKTDHDFFPRRRASEYQKADEAVMRSGRPAVNCVESAPEAEGSPRLVMTSKLPLRNAAGEIIGVAGFSRPLERVRSRSSGEARFARVIEQMHQRPEASLTSAAMARECGLSQSQFDRSFRRVFGTSARQYLLRVRVEAACRRLAETEDTVAALAVELGFFDHAHFTRCFRRIMGMTPAAYRRQSRMPKITRRGT